MLVGCWLPIRIHEYLPTILHVPRVFLDCLLSRNQESTGMKDLASRNLLGINHHLLFLLRQGLQSPQYSIIRDSYTSKRSIYEIIKSRVRSRTTQNSRTRGVERPIRTALVHSKMEDSTSLFMKIFQLLLIKNVSFVNKEVCELLAEKIFLSAGTMVDGCHVT